MLTAAALACAIPAALMWLILKGAPQTATPNPTRIAHYGLVQAKKSLVSFTIDLNN